MQRLSLLLLLVSLLLVTHAHALRISPPLIDFGTLYANQTASKEFSGGEVQVSYTTCPIWVSIKYGVVAIQVPSYVQDEYFSCYVVLGAKDSQSQVLLLIKARIISVPPNLLYAINVHNTTVTENLQMDINITNNYAHSNITLHLLNQSVDLGSAQDVAATIFVPHNLSIGEYQQLVCINKHCSQVHVVVAPAPIIVFNISYDISNNILSVNTSTYESIPITLRTNYGESIVLVTKTLTQKMSDIEFIEVSYVGRQLLYTQISQEISMKVWYMIATILVLLVIILYKKK